GLRRRGGDGEEEVVVGRGEAVGDGDRRRLVALGVLLVVLDVEAGVGERGLEAVPRGVQRGVGDDLGDADGVGLGLLARAARRGLGRAVGRVVRAAAVAVPAGGEEEGGGGQGNTGQAEG